MSVDDYNNTNNSNNDNNNQHDANRRCCINHTDFCTFHVGSTNENPGGTIKRCSFNFTTHDYDGSADHCTRDSCDFLNSYIQCGSAWA